MYDGCIDGRGLEEIQRVYGLVLPAEIKELRFCDQESWSGSAGEMRFETSKAGLKQFIKKSSRSTVPLVEVDSLEQKRQWEQVPEGLPVESGIYVNRVGGCDNSIDISVVDLERDAVRVYLKLVCAS